MHNQICVGRTRLGDTPRCVGHGEVFLVFVRKEFKTSRAHVGHNLDVFSVRPRHVCRRFSLIFGRFYLFCCDAFD